MAENIEKFYKMPKSLFGPGYANLSSDAKLLYMLISDRVQLSIANGWQDSSGKVYCYFKREEMMDMLGLSAASIRKLMKQLQEYKLIEEKRQGFGKPNRIYLLLESADSSDAAGEKLENQVEEKMIVQIEKKESDKKYQSRMSEFDNQEGEFLTPNKTENNKTKENYTESESDQDAPEAESDSNQHNRAPMEYKATIADWSAIFRRRLLEPFMGTSDESMANSIIELMAETMVSQKKSVKIHGENLPIETVRSRFVKLNWGHIQYVIHSIRTSAVRKIFNLKSYLLTCVYESFTTMETYYANAVNCAAVQGVWTGRAEAFR